MSNITIQSRKTQEDLANINNVASDAVSRLGTVENELQNNLGNRVNDILNEGYVRATLDNFLASDDELSQALTDAIQARANLHDSVKAKYNRLVQVLYEGLDIQGIAQHELELGDVNEPADNNDGGASTGGGDSGDVVVEEPSAGSGSSVKLFKLTSATLHPNVPVSADTETFLQDIIGIKVSEDENGNMSFTDAPADIVVEQNQYEYFIRREHSVNLKSQLIMSKGNASPLPASFITDGDTSDGAYHSQYAHVSLEAF